MVDCLQSAFSLKIRLILISVSAIANHDVMLQLVIVDTTAAPALYIVFLLLV